jgi:hypothetical protein
LPVRPWAYPRACAHHHRQRQYHRRHDPRTGPQPGLVVMTNSLNVARALSESRARAGAVDDRRHLGPAFGVVPGPGRRAGAALLRFRPVVHRCRWHRPGAVPPPSTNCWA